MLVALDYDGTYTEDPELWQAFISNARERGHQVFVVTMRYEEEGDDVKRHLLGRVDRIVFTSRKGKAAHLAFLGHKPDIWIDDRPEFIIYGATE